MTNKERKAFEKELKEALDNLAAVIYKYYPDNSYLDVCFMEDRVHVSNDFWKDRENGIYYTWCGDNVNYTLEDVVDNEKEGGNSDSV